MPHMLRRFETVRFSLNPKYLKMITRDINSSEHGIPKLLDLQGSYRSVLLKMAATVVPENPKTRYNKAIVIELASSCKTRFVK